MSGMTRGMGAIGALMIATGCVMPLDIGWTDIRGNGRVVAETRRTPAFDGIVASGGVRVVVERTGRERVVVSAEENLLDHLETEVRGGVLHVGPVPGVNLSPRKDIIFHIESYEVVEINGSGATVLDVELGWVPELWVELSGASVATLWGEADVQHVRLSGASRYDGLDVDALTAGVDVSGASRALVWVRDRLDAEASGASHVRFRGTPWVSARVSGASSVTPY